MFSDVPQWIQAVVLGVVQGATEFIPVSSSGHLVLVPFVLEWERPGLAFDVALHAGTALAIAVYFRRELWAMASAMLRPSSSPQGPTYRRLALFLVVASVPVAILGLTLRDLFESAFETPRLAAVLLLVTAAILVGGEKVRQRRVARAPVPVGAVSGDPGRRIDLPTGEDPEDPEGTTLEGVTLRQAVLIGFSQAVALLPGVSRSGSTITGGMAAGLTRAAATRFSFLLGLPAMVGAFVTSIPDLAEPGIFSGPEIAGGVVAAFVAGYVAIAFLVKLVSRTGLHVFAIYLVAASAGTLVLSFVR